MQPPFPKPVLGFAAFSGTGKTTLLTQLIPRLRQRGVRLAVVKHAHHSFDTDTPGKDSYELRKAGAVQTLVASSQRWALMTENPEPAEPELAQLLPHLDLEHLDLVLVEGFKQLRFAKIELHRRGREAPWLFPQDDSIIAVACDSSAPPQCTLPVLDINDPDAIVAFILRWIADHSS